MTVIDLGMVLTKVARGVQIALVLGGIILVHEFGHFIAAKWSKMTVDEFAVGVGPTLKTWRRGGTLYRLCPFLFMGYVRIRGLEGEEHPDQLEGSFYSRPIPHRLFALLAGAGMNVVFAVVLFIALYGIWGVPYRPPINEVRPGSPAAQAGVEPGWVVVSVDGRDVRDAGDITRLVLDSEGRPLTLSMVRGSQARQVVVVPELSGKEKLYRIGLTFRYDSDYNRTIARVDRGGPAYRAGLRAGDTFVAVAGKPIEHPFDILEAFARVPEADELKKPGEVTLAPVPVTVARDRRELSFTVRPEPKREQRETPTTNGAPARIESYLIGDAGLVLDRAYERIAPAAAVTEGFRRSIGVLDEVFRGLGELIGQRRFDQVGGPVQIIKLLSQAAFMGWHDLLDWAGVLSILIGVFNLLPLPALDGGRVLFVVIEPLARGVLKLIGVKEPRETSRRLESWIHALGLVVLLLLMVVVSVRDVGRW